VAKGKRGKPSSKRSSSGPGRPRGKSKPSKSARPRPPRPEPAADDELSRSDGQRLYDMPYSSPAPRLINAELGLHNLVARAGEHAAYSIDVTLLDAPDHRLMRTGVLLAHRVVDGRGEWFLTAPEWQPLLPKDRIELMGDAELPEEFAYLLRPLRRRATLGPVAALTCERREFALRDDRGGTLALLRDDKVTVRRGGLTTARYREVMITPVGAGLNEAQLAWLDRAFTHSGANRFAKFPRLVSRLGAPATGPTDIPQPREFDPNAPFKRFVSQLLALRLRRIVEADLAIRTGDLRGPAQLADQATQLRLELKGLSPVLDSDWLEDLYDELDWIDHDTSSGDSSGGALHQTGRPGAPPDHVVVRMRSERYLTLLERLVSAARSPKLAGFDSIQPGGQTTEEVLAALVVSSTERLRRTVEDLKVDSPPAAWGEAQRALGQVHWVADLFGHVESAEVERLHELLAEPERLLAAVRADHAGFDAAEAAAEQLPPREAFEAGREVERQSRAARRTRKKFLQHWARVEKLLAAQGEAGDA